MILFITELLHYGLRRMERSNDRISHYCKIKIAQGERKNWKEELLTYLFAYRTTPHSTLGISSAEALYGRKLRTKLPELPRSTLIHTDPLAAETILTQMSQAIDVLTSWMAANRRLLNTYKAQAIWLGGHRQLAKIDGQRLS